MDRQSFLCFTIQSEDFDPVVAKEEIGLPCELYYKNQLVKTTEYGRKIISQSTRWVYSAVSKVGANTEIFLLKHLKIIEKKKSALKPYVERCNTLVDLEIYENDAGKESITLNENVISLLNSIGTKLCVSFKDLERIYGITKLLGVKY